MDAGRTVFTGARLLGAPISSRGAAWVVVDGARIGSAGEGSPPPARPGDRVVDLAGRTLMPGMVQSHFHSAFGHFGAAIRVPALGLEAPPAYLGMLAAKNANTALHCGFTGTIGSSNGDGIDVCLREAIGLGVVEGPRMRACTRELASSGDLADGANRSWFMRLGSVGLLRRCDGPAAFRAAIREEVGRGADVVKISAAPGHAAGVQPDACYLTEAELLAVAETAHERGAIVRAHCPTRAGILACARAGIDIIDHADRLDAECIDAMSKAGSTVCPSMLWTRRLLGMAESWDHTAQPFPMGRASDLESTLQLIRDLRREYDYTASMLPELARSGVRIAIGDDFGTPLMPHGDYVSELDLYVKELGIAPRDVLRWATRSGAVLMGCGDELGTIEPGKRADLLVIDGDPLADVAILGDPARMLAILKDGRFIRDALD